MDMFDKLQDESVIDYIMRLAELKKDNKGITWQLIADYVGENFGLDRTESWVRKTVKKELGLIPDEHEDILDCIQEQQEILDETYLKIKKEKAKLSDERVQVNAYYRTLAREETIQEIAIKTAQEMSNKKILQKFQPSVTGDKEAILCISDWHYGIEIKNPWNEFNTEICKDRVSKLLAETIKRIKENKCKVLHIANLGDLIAGRIHLNLRLDSRIDVITQTMQVSEILAEFINELTKYVYVDYYDCIDNHSRLEPNKKEAQDLETLARIIPWYLKERFKDNDNIVINSNKFGYDISTFESLGHKVISVHGDKDKPATVMQSISSFTRDQYDLVLMAHRHHVYMDESCGTLLVCNGSLMGTDSFAQKLRLNSPASQNLIIVSKDLVMDTLYRIVLV